VEPSLQWVFASARNVQVFRAMLVGLGVGTGAVVGVAVAAGVAVGVADGAAEGLTELVGAALGELVGTALGEPLGAGVDPCGAIGATATVVPDAHPARAPR
jgi:hypothetical protein